MVVAADEDSHMRQWGTLTYSLAGAVYNNQSYQDHFGLVSFNNSAYLFLKQELTLNVSALVYLELAVADGGGEQSTADILVLVVNASDSAPSISAPQLCFVDEDAKVGQSAEHSWHRFCSVQAASTYPNAKVHFFLQTGPGCASCSDFSIDEYSGQVLCAGALDYETKPVYNLTILAVDLNTGLSSSVPLLVTVVDVNEQPLIQDLSVTLQENTKEGYVVVPSLLNLTSDPDLNSSSVFCCNVTFSISAGNDLGIFQLGTNPQGSIVVAPRKTLDYETCTKHSVAITVTDEGGMSSSAVITIHVHNENERPQISSLVRNDVLFIAEDEPAGADLGVICLVHDPDNSSSLSWQMGNSSSIFNVSASYVQGVGAFALSLQARTYLLETCTQATLDHHNLHVA
jgi:hypothetical protein